MDGSQAVILAFILALIVLALFLTLARRFRRCPSNRILVVYGKTNRGVAKTIHGGAAFVWPLIQDYAYLSLEPFAVPIELDNALSIENIRVSVPTTVTTAISTDPALMANAAVRLLGLSKEQIQSQAEDIILGQMRAVIATMAIEEINRDRLAFMERVNEALSGELEKVGLSVINVNVRDISDESGYIQAIGRKAAAEAINQALIDVAEQEKTGQTGVAERVRDRRRSVAAAEAAAEIGEKEAERDRRQQLADLDAQAVQTETQNDAKKAQYTADKEVIQQEARRLAQEASRVADGAIRVAEENAQRNAEIARAERENARLKAEVIVPAQANLEQVTIAAQAEKQRQELVATGAANAVKAKMFAEAEGTQAILDAKADGYKQLVNACGGSQAASTFLVIEKLAEVAGVQAQAIKDLPIEKVMVWDSGSDEGGLSGLGRRLVGVLPPMHEVAKMAGLELPEYLGNIESESSQVLAKDASTEDKPASAADTQTDAGEMSTSKAE